MAEGGVAILINNADISHIGDVETTSEDEFVRLVDVNVKGYFNLPAGLYRDVKEKQRRGVIDMASTAAVAGVGNRFAHR
jgi:NAD(P)-dependent dehydrogenase (short-subunit alcohol dehydrogenase family)